MHDGILPTRLYTHRCVVPGGLPPQPPPQAAVPLAQRCQASTQCTSRGSRCSPAHPTPPQPPPRTHPPTHTHREDVDAINAQQLKALPGEARRFAAQDVGSPDVLAAACPARRTLELKVGWAAGGAVDRAGAQPDAPLLRTCKGGLHSTRSSTAQPWPLNRCRPTPTPATSPLAGWGADHAHPQHQPPAGPGERRSWRGGKVQARRPTGLRVESGGGGGGGGAGGRAPALVGRSQQHTRRSSQGCMYIVQRRCTLLAPI